MTNKVDGITLLQMIKDGKIKDNSLIEVSGGFRTHYPYMKFGENKRLYWQNEGKTINSAVLTDDILEYEFGIIEEEKPKEMDEKHNFYSYAEYEKNKREVDKVLYIIRAINKLEEKYSNIAKVLNYLLKKEENKE